MNGNRRRTEHVIVGLVIAGIMLIVAGAVAATFLELARSFM